MTKKYRYKQGTGRPVVEDNFHNWQAQGAGVFEKLFPLCALSL